MGNRKRPFGYKMVMGEIVIHPQEAQAVQGIYARYLTGASFNDITDHLKEKGPPYNADKPWNKNMVARILEDNRYAGTERFPAILSPEQLQEAAQRRSERKPAVQITEAQKALRRLCNGRPSAAVESQVLSLLNGLAAAPEQIKPQPQTVNRGELAEVERRFSAALATSPVDEDGAKELALRLAGMQYNAIGGTNAGGFYDPGGGGNGGIPDGLVMRDGTIAYGNPGTWYLNVIGFDADHILHVGDMSGQQALDLGLMSAVSFSPGPVLVKDGELQTNLGGGMNPRTCIGQCADGTILLMVIEGRKPDSMGATYDDIAKIMYDRGAVNAANLDGGSSSLMYYNGEQITRGSNIIGMRQMSTAILILN